MAFGPGEKWMLGVSGTALAAMLLCFGAGRAAPGELRPLPAPSSAPVQTVPAGDAVDINTADLEQLMTLPGIGPARAQAILAYREEHGPFQYPEQLIYVDGIGESTLYGLLDHIVAGGM